MTEQNRAAKPNLWGGRFEEPVSAALRQWSDSLSFDRELFDDDVVGSIAWAQALGRAQVLTGAEVEALVHALEGIRTSVDAPFEGYEDVHSFVESELTARVGALAGKLHTGRSRNDQVATDLRLFLRRAARETGRRTLDLADALASRASEEAGTPMPGYTHLKQAEPITFGHWCLAYTQMLLRDVDRVSATLRRGDECPLGSAALSGTPLPIDRVELARSLGFSAPTTNSLDAVSNRDMAADYLYDVAMIFGHLSRMSEDVIFFSSDEVGFLELPDTLATGSSRMPQKKNPDLLELVRGHSGRAIGELTGLLSLMKGLPLSYNKDLQLDKEPIFRMRKSISLALPLLASLIESIKLNRDRMRASAQSDLLLATEVADAIAARGVPFREAHHIVSKRIGESLRSRQSLTDLGPSADITASDLSAVSVDRALERRSALGGTAPEMVAKAAADARKKISEARSLFE